MTDTFSTHHANVEKNTTKRQTKNKNHTSRISNCTSNVNATIHKQMWLDFNNDAKTVEIDVTALDVSLVELNDICTRCSGEYRIGEDGFPVCQSCGMMNTQALDYSPEWRFFSVDDRNATDPSRCGNPIDPLLEQSSYAVKVLCGNVSSTEMKNLRKWISWQAMPANEKALYEEFQIISSLSHNGGLSKIIIDSAKAFYKDFYERQTFRGMNRDATRIGSVWLACWKHGCPRSANELASIFRVDKATASAGCTRAEEMLKNIEQSWLETDRSQFTAITPGAFIERFCSKLQFSEELTVFASFLAKRIETQNLIPDNRPQAVAVGIIYFISHHCQLGYSKLAIKNALDSEVSEVTINKCFQKLDQIGIQLIPRPLLLKYTAMAAASANLSTSIDTTTTKPNKRTRSKC